MTALRKALALDSTVIGSLKAQKFLELNKNTPSLPEKQPMSGKFLTSRSSSQALAQQQPQQQSPLSSAGAALAWLRALLLRSRPFVVVGVVWFGVGKAVSRAGNAQLGDRIQQWLRLAVLAATALFVQGQVSQHARSLTKAVLARFFGQQ